MIFRGDRGPKFWKESGGRGEIYSKNRIEVAKIFRVIEVWGQIYSQGGRDCD